LISALKNENLPVLLSNIHLCSINLKLPLKISTSATSLIKSYYVTCILSQLGWTALHWAAIGENIQVVEVLIRSGADVNAFDEVSWYVFGEMS